MDNTNQTTELQEDLIIQAISWEIMRDRNNTQIVEFSKEIAPFKATQTPIRKDLSDKQNYIAKYDEYVKSQEANYNQVRQQIGLNGNILSGKILERAKSLGIPQNKMDAMYNEANKIVSSKEQGIKDGTQYQKLESNHRTQPENAKVEQTNKARKVQAIRDTRSAMHRTNIKSEYEIKNDNIDFILEWKLSLYGEAKAHAQENLNMDRMMYTDEKGTRQWLNIPTQERAEILSKNTGAMTDPNKDKVTIQTITENQCIRDFSDHLRKDFANELAKHGMVKLKELKNKLQSADSGILKTDPKISNMVKSLISAKQNRSLSTIQGENKQKSDQYLSNAKEQMHNFLASFTSWKKTNPSPENVKSVAQTAISEAQKIFGKDTNIMKEFAKNCNPEIVNLRPGSARSSI